MPIYEYRCDDCEAQFEVLQKMSDDPLEVCERCGGHLRKVLHPVAIHFKGSGFYTTDYGRSSKGCPPTEAAEESGSNGGSAAGSPKEAAKSADTAAGAAEKSARAGTPASR